MIRGLQDDYKILLKSRYLPQNSPLSVDGAGTARRKIALLLVAFSALLGSLPGRAAESKTKVSPWVATWTLDPATSRFAGPVPRQLRIEIAEADARRVRFTVAGTAADGTAFRETFAGPPDGRPHPVLAQGREVSRGSFRWTADGILHGETVDPEGAAKTFTVELAGDGQTLTETRHVKTPTGEYDVVLVFHR